MTENERGPGRPPKGPKAGKGHTLTTRITAETREALEAEAARTGRSISQTAELWMDEARKGRADLLRMFGGVGTAYALDRLAAIAREIESRTEGAELGYRLEVLRAAWLEAIPRLLPPQPSTVDFSREELAIELAGFCQQILDALEDAPDGDPQLERSKQAFDLQRGAGLLGGSLLSEADRADRETADRSHWARSIGTVLMDCKGPEDMQDTFTALHALAVLEGPASQLIGEALALENRFLQLQEDRRKQDKVGQTFGRAIARAMTNRPMK